ncbi:antirestriction protein ArdA [Enterococcus faecalis]|uniref:antirestriction protein ArdA n=1 Tax=Enterococcus faecalis TaxID=1351 RepID=UPI000352FE20|nr:antirestriction protein ArdA [Enterococcus faecalis]EPI27676.1 antirestriction protein ArdA [Enterococcus faecalis UP2S-6]MEB8140023.1 antirestriction protein ArdA [Enterococcus faecalis]NSV98120.1 antirestriction protein ArdA [Enterococcus faecalis]TQB12098.1 antirestriction protein ArdA [Enterococcus faecalis]
MKKLVTYNMMIEANGHRFGGDSEHWIYLTNLKAYNEGVLLGVYLHFPFDSDDLDAAYKAIYIGNQFVDEFGYPYEEYFITDYDAPFSIEEYDSPSLLAEKYDCLQEYMNYPDDVVRIIANHDGEAPTIYELYEGSTDEEKLGYVLIDDGLIIVPEHLRIYIDYEALGRDYALNTTGEFAEDHFIEFI